MKMLGKNPELVSEADRVKALRIVERWMDEWPKRVMERLALPFDAEGYMWFRGIGGNMVDKWVKLIEGGVIKEGSVFRSTTFWAMSVSPGVAEDYASGGGAIFHIVSRSGKIKGFPVFGVSVFPNEVELLITPGERMRFLRARWKDRKTRSGRVYKILHIWLEVLD